MSLLAALREAPANRSAASKYTALNGLLYLASDGLLMARQNRGRVHFFGSEGPGFTRSAQSAFRAPPAHASLGRRKRHTASMFPIGRTLRSVS